jgi:hypothetical protein
MRCTKGEHTMWTTAWQCGKTFTYVSVRAVSCSRQVHDIDGENATDVIQEQGGVQSHFSLHFHCALNVGFTNCWIGGGK